MKRFTLMAVAVLMFASAAVAQNKAKTLPTPKKVDKAALTKVPERPVLKVTDLNSEVASKFGRQIPKVASQQKQLVKQAKLDGKLMKRQGKAATKAQRRAAGIIVDQPEGTYHNMVYACSYFGYSWYGLYNGEYSDAFSEVVEGTDGCLYIHNMVTELRTEEGYWVKAEKVDGEADTYVIHEQPIYVEEYWGTTYTYSIMKVVLSGNTLVPASNTDIKITWKNNTLRTAAEFNDPNAITTAIGACDQDGGWSGACNWNVTMKPQTAVAITELPAGVEAQEMVMKYISGYKEDYDEEGEPIKGDPVYAAEKVKMAINGNDIYLQYYTGIDSWIKGTINGDKASFPNLQYLGADASYGLHVYFIGANENYQMPENVVFDYDPATKKLSNSGLDIYANGSSTKIYYLEVYTNPEIYQFVETAATPQAVDPSTFYGMNYNRQWGYGYLDFEIPCFDVDGNYMNTDKLYYKVYVGDDENNSVFTFTPEEYSALTENMTEVPYSFYATDFWCSGAGHEFVTYVNQAKNFGVQVIYKGGGEEHASEISWNGDNNGAWGYESVFPQVENPQVNSKLAEGEMALNLGAADYDFGSGSAATETYDVAMKVVDDWSSGAKLTGKKVAGISIPFISIQGISNAKAWLSTSIELNADGTFTPNGPVKAFTLADNGFTTVRFDEPYEIPEDGLYIGYTLTATPDAETGEAKPIVLTQTANIGGFLIHSDKVYRLGWADMVNSGDGDLALEAILTGCDADASEVSRIQDTYLKTGEAGQTTAFVTNYGYKGLQSIAYNYKVGGYDAAADKEISMEGNGEAANISLPPVFGGYKAVTMAIPAISAASDDIFYVDITKANGKDNAIEDREAQCNVYVMNFIPKKRPLMEEYTGTWCGFCPRGFVGLEKMAELYPEDFIALSYHNDDPMEVMHYTLFPSDIQGFPAAYLDRVWEVDAYSGFEQEGFAIDKAWLQRCQEFGTADIDVEATWSEDKSTIDIKSTAKFARSEDFASYRIAYAVVADGLKGTTDDWAQSNYYSGGDYGYPEYMEQFTNGESHVAGLTFNDVLAATTEYTGVEGSLPETIVAGETYSHTYSFNAADIVNTAYEPVIQDKNKVKIVAILVSEWGDVLNVNRCKVSGATGIKQLNGTTDNVVKTEYYDLTGRKVLVPANGIYVKSQQLKNGETVNSKVIIR